MEHVLDKIANGHPGYVTAYGMGGVFFALVCLYLFTLAMSAITKSRRPRHRHDERVSRARTIANPAPAAVEKPDDEGAAIAAAIAVAYAMQTGGRRLVAPAGVVGRAVAQDRASAWRAAGRLDLMSPRFRRG